MKSKLPSRNALMMNADAMSHRLIALFRKAKLKRHKDKHLALGMKRLSTIKDVAVLLARYMKKRGLDSTKEFAHDLRLDHEFVDKVRVPIALQPGPQKEVDRYLIALCDLDWDPETKQYVPYDSA